MTALQLSLAMRIMDTVNANMKFETCNHLRKCGRLVTFLGRTEARWAKLIDFFWNDGPCSATVSGCQHDKLLVGVMHLISIV